MHQEFGRIIFKISPTPRVSWSCASIFGHENWGCWTCILNNRGNRQKRNSTIRHSFRNVKCIKEGWNGFVLLLMKCLQQPYWCWVLLWCCRRWNGGPAISKVSCSLCCPDLCGQILLSGRLHCLHRSRDPRGLDHRLKWMENVVNSKSYFWAPPLARDTPKCLNDLW